MRITAAAPQHGLILEDGKLEELQRDPDSIRDPVLRDAIGILNSPLREILVNITGARGPRRLAFSLGESFAAVLMSKPGAPVELAAVTTDAIPSIIARAAGLGPAPFADERAVKLPAAEFDALTFRPPIISKKLAVLPIGTMLAAHTWNICGVQVSAVLPDNEVVGLRLDFIGVVDEGWWLLIDRSHKVEATRVTSSLIWTYLCDITIAEADDGPQHD